MLSLLANEFTYLLDTFDYDPNEYEGPPHYVSGDEISQLFGQACKIELLDRFERPPFNRMTESYKTQPLECVRFLTRI